MSELVPIGPIARLQIQKEALVVGVRPTRTYRTEPLVSVESLVVSSDGAVARIGGSWVLDRHHASHPASAPVRWERLLSVGFTGHYKRMEADFPFVEPGIGGENVIVETPDRIVLDDIAGGLVIRTASGDLYLDPPAVANPCAPFTRRLLGRDDATIDEVKAPLDLLRHGMRGYVMGLADLEGSVEVNVADLVLMRVAA